MIGVTNGLMRTMMEAANKNAERKRPVVNKSDDGQGNKESNAHKMPRSQSSCGRGRAD